MMKEDHKKLYQAVLSLQNEEECETFFSDLTTIPELNAMAQRLNVADMLYHKKTCAAISETLGVSTTTVSRVNRCFLYGPGGYRMVLDRLSKT